MLKVFFSTLHSFFKNFDYEDKKTERWCILGAALIVAMTVSIYSVLLYNYATTEPILRAYDEDSSYGVEISLKTELYNHNGSNTYGPLYYRLAIPFRNFLQPSFLSQGLNTEDVGFRNAHFHMLFLNLLFAVATCILLLRALTHSWVWVLLGSVPLLGLFLQNYYRSVLLIMVKPDWAVSFFISVAGWVLFDAIRNCWNEAGIKKVALAWAVASLTKLLTIFYIPSMLAVFYLTDARNFKKNLVFMLKWFCLFYFLIGFPQSWDIPGGLRYLLQQNKHTSLVDWTFLTEKWLPLFFDDLWRPALFLVFFAFLVPKKFDARLTPKFLITAFGFSILGALMLISKQTRVPFEWYTFGFVNLLLLTLVYFLRWLFQRFTPVFQFFNTGYRAIFCLLAFFLAAPKLIPFFSEKLESHYKQGFVCRPEYKEISDFIDSAVQRGELVFVDNHAPYHTRQGKGFVDSAKDHGMDRFLAKNYSWVVLNKNYYSTIFKPEIDDALLAERGVVAAKVYRLFDQKDQLMDANGRLWKLLKTNGCGYHIWQNSNFEK